MLTCSKLLCAALVPSTVLVVALASAPRPSAGGIAESASGQPSNPGVVARGRYLVNIAGCNDCHSPHDERGELIPGRQLTGHPLGMPTPEWDPSLMKRNIATTISPTFTAFAGPFGVSLAPNLTPDMETGIGKMTAEDLIKSWRTGRHWNIDRPILPPMPIASFKELPDEDIRAIFAYLKSLPPVASAPLSPTPAAAPPK